MPTHDYIIANGTGAAVRADINSALSAIVSLNSNASEPGTMYAYQLWADTALGLLKIRNSTNSAWITLRQLDGDFSIVAVEDGAQATPSLTFTNDLNTGVFRSGADALAIVTGGQYAIACTSTQAVGIRTPNPSTALHVAGNARVGADDVTDAHLQIGKGATGNRNSYIDIVADTTYTDYGLRVIRNNTGANATSELKHRGTGALNFTTQEAAPIVFNTTNSPALTILAGGNVGIGSSSPSANLEVKTTSDVGIALSNSSSVTSGNRGGISMLNSANSSVGLIRFAAVTDNVGTEIQFYTRPAAGSLTQSMTLDSAGRLGIGTTTPTNADKLEIQTSSTSAPGLWIQTGGTTSAYPIADFRTGSNLSALLIRGDGASVFTGKVLVGTSTALGTGQVGFLTSGANQVLTMHNSNATPFGLVVKYTTATPNGTGAQFVYLEDASALRCEIRSNGGIANYSANDANLSDRNVKKDIALAAGTWDCIKEWEIVNYRYKDQPDDAELNLGVIAQQVAESCPEVITIFQEAKDATEDKPAQEERLGVKEQQMYWMAIKALQEAMGRIETLEQRLIAAGID